MACLGTTVEPSPAPAAKSSASRRAIRSLVLAVMFLAWLIESAPPSGRAAARRPCALSPLSPCSSSPKAATAAAAQWGASVGRGGHAAVSPPAIATPCRLFVWDFISACRYRVCVRLLRENLYEGLGGRRFVRIRPGSILESLYPCNDHAPNRCAICGRNFPEHLEEWWKPMLSSPYDTCLDQVSKSGTILPEDEDDSGRCLRRRRGVGRNVKGGRRGGGRVAPSEGYWPSTAKKLCFHRRYVEEISSSKSERRCRQEVNSSVKGNAEETQNEQRSESNIRYRVPSFNRLSLGKISASRELAALCSGLLYFSRATVLEEIDTLLWVQERENALLQLEEDTKLRL